MTKKALFLAPLFLILLLAFTLRFVKLDVSPPSLFGDEIDVGYHALSLLESKRDYSGNFLPLHFQSFAELRTPLYLYASTLGVYLWGITPLGVRFAAAFFGLLGVYFIYLLVRKITSQKVALVAALFLAISPWHMHYSRAGFEVTLLLALILSGTYSFIVGLKKPRFLVLAALLLGLTPWAYNTAKLFLPLFSVLLVGNYWKELGKVSRKYLFFALVTFVIVVVPFAYSTVFGGGSDRFAFVSVFNDIEMEGKIGLQRTEDMKTNLPTLVTRGLHNRFTYFYDKIVTNYLQAYSVNFLFLQGDTTPRHNPTGSGVLYRVDFVFLLAGLFFLLNDKLDKKYRNLLLGWLFISAIPASITRGGGGHATRLILMLPVLTFLVAYGLVRMTEVVQKQYKLLFKIGVSVVYLLSFLNFIHYYFVHYPSYSERWWHSGIGEASKLAWDFGKNYDKVIISSADEPMLLFFLAYNEYSPNKFRQIDVNTKVELGKLGTALKVDNFYFPEIGSDVYVYELAATLPDNSVYIAPVRSVKFDFITEPERIPKDLTLVNTVYYPSGLPAYYALVKKHTDQY